MQSHKRPHELSDILLKNLIRPLRLNLQPAPFTLLQRAGRPISKAAIIPKQLSLSSAQFSSLKSRRRKKLSNSLTLPLFVKRQGRVSGGASYRASLICQPIVFRSSKQPVFKSFFPVSDELSFRCPDICRGRAAHSTQARKKVNTFTYLPPDF